MARDSDVDTEYESDPEEAKMSLKMRRREASDDEDGDDAEVAKDHERDSDSSDGGQGFAAEYDYHDDDDENGEEYYDEAVEYKDGGVEERETEAEEGSREGGEAVDGDGDGEGEVEGEGGELVEESEEKGGEEKKENEPFSVPTSGAFYMHDDRFRANAGGRNRRTFGGRKLWESKDDRKWGHDKFEEMNIPNRRYEEGRYSRGHYRGRGRGRDADRGYVQGGKMRAYGGNNNQISTPRDVRGRGPRRYQPLKNMTEANSPQNKLSIKSIEKTSYAFSGRSTASTANRNAEHEAVPAKKLPSNLNYASPPFYPSGSSNKDISQAQDKEVLSRRNHRRNLHSSVVDHNISMPLSNSVLRGKNVFKSIGMDKLHIDDSVSLAGSKPLNNVHLPSSVSLPLSTTQMPQSRAHGRGVALSGSTMFQPPQTKKQVNKVSPPAAETLQRNPVQNQCQASWQALGQPQDLLSVGASPSKAGKGTAPGAGKGLHVFAGAQVMGSGGNLDAGHGDQNLPPFFPVMQFGAQRPGGVGVPAVGMAFPGYVAQPNGLGNSEMTWLPVLASAAGALGANYCPPYLAVDGTYHPQPTGQMSALPAPSKDNNLAKPTNEVKPQQKSEVSNDEFNQRQNKPRRYSAMKFSQ